MVRLGTCKDLARSRLNVPKEVEVEVSNTIKLLDEHYGQARDVDKDLGGYTLIIETDKDIDKCKKLGITFDATYMPEYVLLIKVEKGEPYTQSLFLANSDYAIVIFIPLSLTPKYIIDMIEQ